jgi:hypothetical protein
VVFSKCTAKNGPKVNVNNTSLRIQPLPYDDFCGIVGERRIEKFKNIKQIVEGEEHGEDFFVLYRLWDHYQQRQEETNKQGNGLDEDAQIRNRQPDSEDLSTDSPVENTEIQSQVLSLPDESNVEQEVNSGGNVTSTKANLINQILVWPETPKRKRKRNTERIPFVLTSGKWKEVHDKKEKLTEAVLKEKAKRKVEREDKKTPETSISENWNIK